MVSTKLIVKKKYTWLETVENCDIADRQNYCILPHKV